MLHIIGKDVNIKSTNNFLILEDTVKDLPFKISKVYGSTNQKNEGSPSSPQEIKNVTGNIKVEVHNNNFFSSENKTNNVGLAWTTGALYTSNKDITTEYINSGFFSEVYSNYVFRIFFYDKDKNYLGNSADLRKGSGLNYTNIKIPNNSEIVYFRLVFSSGVNSSLDMTKVDDIMITNIEIEVQKDIFINSENKTNNVGLAWTTGGLYTSNKDITTEYINSSFFSEVYSNYVFRIFFYDKDKSYLGNSADLRKGSGLSYTNITVPNNSGIAYFRLVFSSSVNSSLDMTTVNDIMITNSKDKVQEDIFINSENKTNNVGLAWTTGILYTSNKDITTEYINSGFFSEIYSNYVFRIFFYDKDRNYLGNSADLRKGSGLSYTNITVPNNSEIVYFRLVFSSGLNYNLNMTKVDDIMITNVKDKENYYIQNKEQIVVFPLSTGQKLYEGSYLAQDGIHHVRSQYTFTGNENFQYFATDSQGNGYAATFDLNSSRKIKTYTKFLCNILKAIAVQSIGSADGEKYAINYALSNYAIYVKLDNTATSATDIKNWLKAKYDAGTPVIIEYELTEEIIEPYTKEQQNAYNELQNLKTYNNITYINFDKNITFELITIDGKLTEEVKEAFKTKNTRAYLLNSNYELSQNNHIQSIDFKDERYNEEKNNFIGEAICKSIDVKLVNQDIQLNLENQDLEYRVGANVNGEYKYISFGNFIVQKPENEEINEQTTFQALDYMCKFNIPYEQKLSLPMTLGDLAENVCEQCEVKLGNKKFRNSNKLIKSNPFINGEQCREVIKSIAKISFSVAYIGQDNKLYFGFDLQNEVDEKIATDGYFELEPNKETKPITVIVLRSSEVPTSGQKIIDNDLIKKYGENELIIEEDYIAYTDELRYEFLQAAKPLLGLTYKPINIDLLGSIYLDFNDVLEITNLKGEKIKTYCLNNIHTYNGTLYNTISSPALTEAQEKYNYETEAQIKSRRTAVEIDKANQKIDLAVEQITDQDEKISEISLEVGSITAEVSEKISEQNQKVAQMQVTVNNISAEVKDKVGEDEIISKINVAVKNKQGVIEITTNQLSISSDYFTLTKDGKVTATAGNIGGLTLENNRLYNTYKNYSTGRTTESGIYIPGTGLGGEAFIYAGASSNMSNPKMYILHDGTINFLGGSLKMMYNDNLQAALVYEQDATWRYLSNGNTFSYEGILNDSGSPYSQAIRLYDAKAFDIDDGVHNLLVARFYRYAPEGTVTQAKTRKCNCL